MIVFALAASLPKVDSSKMEAPESDSNRNTHCDVCGKRKDLARRVGALNAQRKQLEQQLKKVKDDLNDALDQDKKLPKCSSKSSAGRGAKSAPKPKDGGQDRGLISRVFGCGKATKDAEGALQPATVLVLATCCWILLAADVRKQLPVYVALDGDPSEEVNAQAVPSVLSELKSEGLFVEQRIGRLATATATPDASSPLLVSSHEPARRQPVILFYRHVEDRDLQLVKIRRHIAGERTVARSSCAQETIMCDAVLRAQPHQRESDPARHALQRRRVPGRAVPVAGVQAARGGEADPASRQQA
jgi:hypothetical protein